MKLFLRKKVIVGILGIIISLAIPFIIFPMANKQKNETKLIWVFAEDYPAGAKISESMLKKEERGVYGLKNYLVEEELDKALDNYLKVDVQKEDILQVTKISKESSNSNYLEEIPENKNAISFSVQSFAKGLSAKLLPNDVIKIVSLVKESKEAEQNFDASDIYKGEIRNELNYVKVLSVTYPTAVDLRPDDKRDENTSEKNLPVTITVLADNVQAKSIAELEEKGSIHVALVYRGVKFQEYLDLQDKINEVMFATEVNLLEVLKDASKPVEEEKQSKEVDQTKKETKEQTNPNQEAKPNEQPKEQDPNQGQNQEQKKEVNQ